MLKLLTNASPRCDGLISRQHLEGGRLFKRESSIRLFYPPENAEAVDKGLPRRDGRVPCQHLEGKMLLYLRMLKLLTMLPNCDGRIARQHLKGGRLFK